VWKWFVVLQPETFKYLEQWYMTQNKWLRSWEKVNESNELLEFETGLPNFTYLHKKKKLACSGRNSGTL
jgi:hypothetical protein